MMRWIFGLWITLSWGVVSSFAQEVRRPDPQADARLNQTLTIRYAATPLKNLLADLTRRTGVSLTVEPRVGEYRAFARLKEKPLHEVMRLLAKAFGFEWRAEDDPKKPDAPPRYVLYQPAADRLAEQQWQKLHQTNMVALLREIVRSLPPELLQRDHLQFANAIGASPYYISEAELNLDPMQLEPPFRTIMQFILPDETDPYRVLFHHARRSVLYYAGSHHYAWLALQLMARFSERDWQSLSELQTLAVAVDSIPDDLWAQWAEAEQKFREKHPAPTDTVPTEEMEITDEPESDEPASGTDDEQIRMIIEGLEAEQPEWLSVQFAYDALAQTLRADFCSVLTEPNRVSRKQMPAFVFELRDWLEIAYGLFGVGWDEVMRISSESEPYNLWELKTPFATIRDAAWRRAKQSDWSNWLSYRYIEACEGADIETVGEFYPLFTRVSIFGALPPARNWRELMYLMTRAHRVEFDGKVVVWSAAARPLTRLTDAPHSRLRAWLTQEAPTLETLAAMTVALPQEAFSPLLSARAQFLNESAQTDATHTDAWFNALQKVATDAPLYWTLRLYHSLTQPQRDALRRRGLAWNNLSQSQKAIALRLLTIKEMLAYDCEQPLAYRSDAPTLQLRLSETRSAPMRKTVSKPDEKGVWRTQAYRYQKYEHVFTLNIGKRTIEIELDIPEPLPETEPKKAGRRR